MSFKKLPDNERFQDKGIMEPLPSGPYITIHQHDAEYFKKHFATMNHRWETEFVFPRWGHVVFASDLHGQPIMVAHNFDTSD
ncbi:MAG: hypothetical protein ACHQUC_01400 [Chlamydiales bacterium]